MPEFDPSADASLLDALAEEFIARHRSGERPSITEYTVRRPDLAESIRDLFPTLLMIENARPNDGCESAGRSDALNLVGGNVPVQLGDYRILREIGRGGMGIVYEAEQEALGRHVALKVLPKHAMLNPHQLDRFHHEARAAARLHHTNIVPVFGVGNHAGLHYHVMQFIQGLGLDEVLVEVVRLRDQKKNTSLFSRHNVSHPASPASGAGFVSPDALIPPAPSAARVAEALVSGQFTCASDGSVTADAKLASSIVSATGENVSTARQASRSSSSGIHLPGQNEHQSESGGAYWNSIARIGAQVADALAYANTQGVLHRDIKPSNLLLDTTGTVWVTDFGLAKTSDSEDLTHTGDIVGTLRYMAPERFCGSSDIQCDIYSLGITLYELLTLRHPFSELDRHKLVRQIAQEEPPRPRSIERTLPRDLETIVLKAIAKQPSDRYQNAESLAADLRRFIEDRPIHARRIGSVEWFWRWCRRNPLVAGLASTVVMLATVLFVGATIMHLVRGERDSALSNLNSAIDAEKAAKQHQLRAEQAEGEVKIRSHLAQAAALRHAGQAGRRAKSLDEIQKAMELSPAPALRSALRNEAIACLALVDLQTIDVPQAAYEPRIAFDRTYKLFATVDNQGKIHVRNVDEEHDLREFPGHGQVDIGLSFSPQGQYLLSSQQNKLGIQVWDLKSGGRVFAEPMLTSARPSLSHDDRRVAIITDSGSIGVYELASGREVDRLTTGTRPTVVAFDPLGNRLAVASANPPAVEIWDLPTKTSLTKFADIQANIHAIAWDDDGRRLALGLANPVKAAEVWDVANNSKLATFTGHLGDVTNLFFHPSGEILVTNSWDGFTRIWDANSARLFLAWPGGMGGSVSFDGRILGKIYDRGQNRLVELVGDHEYQTLVSSLGPGKGELRDASISPDGRLLAIGMGDGVRIWDLQHYREAAYLDTGESPSPIFTPDGKELITSGESGLQRWPLSHYPLSDSLMVEGTRNRFDHGLAGANSTSTESPACAVLHIGPPRDVTLPIRPSYASDARSMLGVCSPGSGQGLIVDLATDRIEATLGPHSQLDRLVLSPDGCLAATYGWHSSTLKIWDVKSAALVKEFPAQLLTVKFSPDSQRLITCDSNEYCFWDVTTWQRTRTIPREHCPFSGVIAFSADGHLMALELSSAVIYLMDSKTGETLAKLEDPYRDRPNWMNFTPDGAKLVAVSNYSQCINVWDLNAIRRKLKPLRLDWDAKPVPTLELENAFATHVTVELGDFGSRAESRHQANQAKALFGLANSHIQARRWADALVTSKQALGICPDSATYNNSLAWLLVSCPDSNYRDANLAVQLALKAVELEPSISEYWNTLGVAHYRAGQWQQSIDRLTKAEQLKPDVNYGHNAFFLALAYWRLDEKETAQEFFDQAIQWMNSTGPSVKDREELDQFRAEAIELLGK